MRITKLGHCCMVLDIDGVKILTDPGNMSQGHTDVEGLNAVLITHDHQDHLHVDALKDILAKNPTALIIGNSTVAKAVGEGIADTQVTVVGDGQATDVKGIKIEGFGSDHALIYGDMGKTENTGFLVGERFYFPGDNFERPGRAVDVLALPVSGPWMKLSEAIDFAKDVKARVAFGVHDAMTTPESRPFVGRILGMFVPETEYVSLKDGETREF